MLTVDKVVYHPDCNGPGRNRACVLSSKQSGCRRFDPDLSCPRDSSWKTAVVSERLQHVEAFLVIQRNGGVSSAAAAPFSRAACCYGHLQRPVDDGQRTQTEEVELHQPGIFTSLFIKLGNQLRLPSSSQYSGAKSVILVARGHAASVLAKRYA